MPAKRKGHGAGSVVQIKDGRWQARMMVDAPDGTRKRKVWYAKTETAARLLLAKAISGREEGKPVIKSERLTVEAFLESWLEGVKLEVRAKTYQSYEYVVRVHLIPSLGRKQLSKLEPADIRAMMSHKVDQGLSPRTVGYIRTVLWMALKVAVNDGDKVHRNVAALTKAPKRERHEIRPLTPVQSRALLAAAADHPLEALFTTAVGCGLREGELLGLAWSDVRLDGKRATLVVRQQLQRIDGHLKIVQPKTEKSRRTLVLPSIVRDALIAHRDRQSFQRAKVGDVWQNADDLVFVSRIGTPIHPENLGRSLRPLLKKAKLPPQRFHDLRHACASLLIHQGFSLKDVSEYLGHSSIQITADTYGHLYEERKEALADGMDAILAPHAAAGEA